MSSDNYLFILKILLNNSGLNNISCRLNRIIVQKYGKSFFSLKIYKHYYILKYRNEERPKTSETISFCHIGIEYVEFVLLQNFVCFNWVRSSQKLVGIQISIPLYRAESARNWTLMLAIQHTNHWVKRRIWN